MGKNLDHVVAGPEAEQFERRVKRLGAGAPKAGADDFKRHVHDLPEAAMREGVRYFGFAGAAFLTSTSSAM
jgi:hypothetical protein